VFVPESPLPGKCLLEAHVGRKTPLPGSQLRDPGLNVRRGRERAGCFRAWRASRVGVQHRMRVWTPCSASLCTARCGRWASPPVGQGLRARRAMGAARSALSVGLTSSRRLGSRLCARRGGRGGLSRSMLAACQCAPPLQPCWSSCSSRSASVATRTPTAVARACPCVPPVRSAVDRVIWMRAARFAGPSQADVWQRASVR
jgi:hypothetical protein